MGIAILRFQSPTNWISHEVSQEKTPHDCNCNILRQRLCDINSLLFSLLETDNVITPSNEYRVGPYICVVNILFLTSSLVDVSSSDIKKKRIENLRLGDSFKRCIDLLIDRYISGNFLSQNKHLCSSCWRIEAWTVQNLQFRPISTRFIFLVEAWSWCRLNSRNTNWTFFRFLLNNSWWW